MNGFRWLPILLLLQFSCKIQSQICDNLSGGYQCDGTGHIYHRDKDKIAKYCGKTTQSGFVDKLINGRKADDGYQKFVSNWAKPLHLLTFIFIRGCSLDGLCHC